jgi:hypothetical protein
MKSRCEGCGKKGGAHRKKCPALSAALHAAHLVRSASHSTRKQMTASDLFVGKVAGSINGRRPKKLRPAWMRRAASRFRRAGSEKIHEVTTTRSRSPIVR